MNAKTPKALVLTSDKKRHRYFVSQIGQLFEVVGVLQQAKNNYYSKVQETKDPLIEKHFLSLQENEETFIPNAPLHKNIKSIQATELNNPETVTWAQSLQPDIVFLFGTGILKEAWLKTFHNKIINLHLGLSPFYRGSATLFWPFYDQKLDNLGTTIHIAAAKVDAGGILDQVLPDFEVGDDYYQTTTKLIKKSIEHVPTVGQQYLGQKIQPKNQDLNQIVRLCKKSEFNKEALEKALAFVGSGLSAEQIAHAKQPSAISIQGEL